MWDNVRGAVDILERNVKTRSIQEAGGTTFSLLTLFSEFFNLSIVYENGNASAVIMGKPFSSSFTHEKGTF